MKEFFSEINQHRSTLTCHQRSPPTCYALTQLGAPEASGVGITVYQNEKARLAGHEIRKKGLQTDIFSKHLKDTMVLEGDVLIQFGRNIIEEENQLTT